jgi:hypothetical protein
MKKKVAEGQGCVRQGVHVKKKYISLCANAFLYSTLSI